MDSIDYLAKMELLGDDKAFEDGRIPKWVINLLQKLESSVFKEITKSGIKDLNDPQSKGFFIGLGKLIEQQMQNVKAFDFDKSKKIENSKFIDELSNLYENDKKHSEYSEEELCEFFSALKRGKESVLDEEGQIKFSTLSSEISLIMFTHWPYIDHHIKTRRQMFDYLTKILGPNRVGEYKRVEKFLQRIGFSPARPGRPRTK